MVVIDKGICLEWKASKIRLSEKNVNDKKIEKIVPGYKLQKTQSKSRQILYKCFI